MRQPRTHYLPIAGCLLLLALLLGGCRGAQWLERRDDPYRPGWSLLSRRTPNIPAVSARTQQVLRRQGLPDDIDEDPLPLLAPLKTNIARAPTTEKLYAFAELSHQAAARAESKDEKRAFDLYATSVLHAYQYLFDRRLQWNRNPYDPQFRGACDLYNKSLDRALRIVNRHGGLQPGVTHECRAGNEAFDICIVSRCDGLNDHQFDRFEFVSDFRISGFPNRHETFGLGVPLIALRRQKTDQPEIENHYPPRLAVPMTAFLRIESVHDAHTGAKSRRAVLELHDPLNTRHLQIGGMQVPLQSDTTTPLAYFLDKLEYSDRSAATSGLLWPGQNSFRSGLYMLEPYQSGKIPVLMVHGLWSTPIKWMTMFNELRSVPEIAQNYQFWFFFYPTGQPLLTSAESLRNDLAGLRELLDPSRAQPALDQMVVVGHSMGGLVSKLQTVESSELFWQQVAGAPLEKLDADPETRQQLTNMYFFRPNPSIRRVVTIATPHQGSGFSNATTQWLGRRLITPPPVLARLAQQLDRENPGAFGEDGYKLTRTSIEMLAPDSPTLKALAAAPRAPWVTYHNVIGKVPEGKMLGRVVNEGDAIVSLASARSPESATELVVTASHREIHAHPKTVLEVRRVLLEHLISLQGVVTPIGYESR